MCLGELPKRPLPVGLVPFRPTREAIINELPSHTKKIPLSQTEKLSLRSSATGVGATERVEITLTQAAAARQLSADKASIPLTADAASVAFNVTANVPWEITKSDAPASWITFHFARHGKR